MEELWDLITEEEYATYQKVSWVKYLIELGLPSDLIKKHGPNNFSYITRSLTGYSLKEDIEEANKAFKEHFEDEGVTGAKELEYVRNDKSMGVKAPNGVVIWLESYVHVDIKCVTTEVKENPVFNEDYFYIILKDN